MSTSHTRNSLLRRLRDKTFRAEFVGSRVAAAIAAQVYNLRKRKDWTQEQLARAAGMKQARISIIEQADYENFTLTTLKRLAAAFDVGLIVEFVSFPRFLRWTESVSGDDLTALSFSEAQVGLTSNLNVPIFCLESNGPAKTLAEEVGQTLLGGSAQLTDAVQPRTKSVEQVTFGDQL